MPTETLEQWKAKAQSLIDALPAERKGIPIAFNIKNHLGSGVLRMHTGEMAQEATTGIWVGMLSDTFKVYNPHATPTDKAPYHIVVMYETDFKST